MVKLDIKIAEIATRGVIGGRGPIKSNTGHPGGFLVEAAGCGSGGQEKIFCSIGAHNRGFGRIYAILADFSQKILDRSNFYGTFRVLCFVVSLCWPKFRKEIRI
jgi:hypothetical protein